MSFGVLLLSRFGVAARSLDTFWYRSVSFAPKEWAIWLTYSRPPTMRVRAFVATLSDCVIMSHR